MLHAQLPEKFSGPVERIYKAAPILDEDPDLRTGLSFRFSYRQHHLLFFLYGKDLMAPKYGKCCNHGSTCTYQY
jgi:hypothetical protein